MNDFRTKDLRSAAIQSRQSGQSGQLKRRGAMPLGLLALLSMAACTSSNDSPATETPSTPSESATFVESAVTDSLIYITPEGSLDGVDLEQFDKSSFVLEGSDGATPINLGDLDSSEVSIVTNSEGNQVFAVARSAVNKHASSNSTSSAPISYNLKATSAISFIDRQGKSQTIDVGDVITEDALTIDPALVSVIKELADVQGNTAQLAAITVDLGEVFTSVSAISFSAVDDEGNAIALTDKNRDGIAAEFSLDELAASFGESGTITVRAETASGIFVGQSFSVVVMQHEVNTPFVGDGEVVTITHGSANSASILALPLSGGDGEITYALEGNNKDSGEFFFLQGRLFFSADASGTYTLVATDADGDRATVSIDYTIVNNEVSIANALGARAHEGNDGDVEVNLAEVFAGGDGYLTLTSGDGTIANSILTVDTAKLGDGDNTITVTAMDSDGDTAIDTFVLTVDKSPTIAAAISDDTQTTNSSNTTIDLTTVFANGSGTLAYAVTLPEGAAGVSVDNSALTIDYAALGVGTHSITVTATDSDAQNADSITEVFVLEVRNYDSLLNDRSLGSIVTLAGTTLADAITGNSFAEASGFLSSIDLQGGAGNDAISNNALTASDKDVDSGGNISNITFNGGIGDDTISNNSLIASIDGGSPGGNLSNIAFSGGMGDDTISNNTLIASTDYNYSVGNFSSITFDGGDGDDTISNNTIIDDGSASITFEGGNGNDTINNNTLTIELTAFISFDGGDGNDTISNNVITTGAEEYDFFEFFEEYEDIMALTFDGGSGDDTISGNTITSSLSALSITFDGGAGNDTISDNHIETTATDSYYGFYYGIALMGGAGDDLFRNNSATLANGESASLTIDGGDGEDTVVLRSVASEYAGLSDWIDFSAGGVTTITLTGDGAVVTLIDVETIVFADGVSYSAADAWVEGNEGILYDLANVFPDAETTFTAYSTDTGTIGTGSTGLGTLTLAGTELGHGANTIVITATASDATETTETITINSVKNLEIIGAKQHSLQTFDLGEVFADSITTYALTLIDGVIIQNGKLIFNNNDISIGEHQITITASDGSDAIIHTLNYVLDAIQDQSGDGSNTTYTGTSLADAITGNVFAAPSGDLISINLVGGEGNDTISNNTLSADEHFLGITFDGGDGNDTISGNTLSESVYVRTITFDGGDGNDTISGNTITSGSISTITFDGGDGNDTISGNTMTSGNSISTITFDGGDGNDTISNNTLIANDSDVRAITFDGGDGDDTISDNHLESKSTDSYDGIFAVTLMGGAGDDVFRNNSATQANGESASLTIDGGDGEDTVVLRSLAYEYAGISDWIDFSDGGGTTITLTGDGAAVILIDVETIAFADGQSYSAADAWAQGNGGVLYDLANVFPDPVTAYSTDGGTISDNTLTLAGTELAHGANTIVVTATATDNTETTETITVNAIKTLRFTGAEQHDHQSIDLNAIFVDADSYTATLPSGISLSNSGILSFANGELIAGTQSITITASDGSDVGTHTLTYVLDAIKDQTGSSNSSYAGTTLADAITGNSFVADSGLFNVDLDGGAGNDTISDNDIMSGSGYNDSIVFITFDGGAGNDTINSNTLSAGWAVYSVTFDGGEGNDTINSNTLTASDDVSTITFDGGAGNDTISDNILMGGTGYRDNITSITFEGGAGNDTISGNSLSANNYARAISFNGGDGDDTISGNTISAIIEISTITFDGGDGDDTISNNSFIGSYNLHYINLDGGAGNDTITGNTLSSDRIYASTIDGGDGDDIISDNHIDSTSTYVYGITLKGGAGDDVFRNNTASQANGQFATLTINGGDGEDTVVFRSVTDEYTGITDWIDSSDGGGTTITLTGDGAAVTLIDVETISFVDGTSYSAADAWVEGNGGISYDLANVFPGADTATAFSTDKGTIGTGTNGLGTLTLAGTELRHGASTIVITATASDNTETTETITINAVKNLEIAGAKQHNQQTFDLEDVFAETATTYTLLTPPNGVTLAYDKLIFANNDLSIGEHQITIIATDDGDAISYTLTYALDAIQDQSGGGSNTTFTGTNLADAITGNTFAANSSLHGVTLSGGDGDDTISDNTFTANSSLRGVTLSGDDGNDAISNNTFMGPGDSTLAYGITLDGGEGNDTISNNLVSGFYRLITFDGGEGNDTISNNSISEGYLYSVNFDGGDGNDTISDNSITPTSSFSNSTFDGGDGNDTITGNTLSSDSIHASTINGGDGDDTISDNHIESTSTSSSHGVSAVILMGGAGDDVFRNNSATQANGGMALLTIDGGDGEDTVVLRSIASEYAGISEWINFPDGGVTTITLTGDGAALTLIDVETISFADGASYSAADAGVEGNGGVSYDLANAFAGTFTAYKTDSGTIGPDNTLTLTGAELEQGANTIVVTATASDTTETTETITINAVKNLEIAGAIQHNQQTFDLGDVFAETTTYNALTLPDGITLANGILTFANTELVAGDHAITITATDGGDAVTHTFNYALDSIKDQSGDGSHSSYTGTTLADMITGNTFAKNSSLQGVTLSGGDGDDIINGNTLSEGSYARTIIFDGGDGNDTISGNALTDNNSAYSIAFDGGGGNDAISGNTIIASTSISTITFDGGGGDDTISGNIMTAGDAIGTITFDGGDGNDTISNNTLIGNDHDVQAITFDGGDGDDTISDNHIESTSTYYYHNVYGITLMGGAGDDVFRNNTASQANGNLASLTIDGGVGEDTAVFRLAAGEYAGISAWLNFSGGEVTTITLTGDGAAVTLIDVETIAFADGASYSAADAWVEGNGGALYDLANVFPDPVTAYSTDGGTISDNTLTLAGSELKHGANTIVVTATASDNSETISAITVNAVKNLEIAGAIQHNQQTFDLRDVFAEATTYAALTLPDGVTLANGILTFANTELVGGDHALTITATDGSDAVTYTFNYALDSIKDQSGDSSHSSYSGTSLEDAITGNSLATFGNLSNVYLDGGASNDAISDNTLTGKSLYFITLDGGEGNDAMLGNTLTASRSIYSTSFDAGDGDNTISGNTLTASWDVYSITFVGGDGDDTISGNTLTASSNDVHHITFDGGAGEDTISNNTITGSDHVCSITFDGGAGADTISSNTFIANDIIESITLDGGADADTISDNHFDSLGLNPDHNVSSVILMGGAGDDVFSGNTATQANGLQSSITIDGGAGTDKVYFALASNMFDISSANGSTITVTDKETRTEAADGVDSYAEYVLVDIEELYFGDAESKYEF